MHTTSGLDDDKSPIDKSPIVSPLLTRAEAAEYLRCSPRHIDNLRTAGELQATLSGSRVYYQKSVLDDYIRRQTEPANGRAGIDNELSTTEPDSHTPESRGRLAQNQDRDPQQDGSDSDERDRTRQLPRDAA
ncbi:MAG: helix-turn-helix domain-containing protein [Phycisphaerales bacterium]